MIRFRLLLCPLLLGVTVSTSTLAEEKSAATAEGSLSLTAGGGASVEPKPSGPPKGYMERYKPEPNLFEVGIFGGMFFPSKDHELVDPYAELQPYESVAPELGLRLAYYPLCFAGIEAEGAAMPTHTSDGESAGLWSARGHLVVQAPLASVAPFVLIGGGALGAAGNSLGTDMDPLFHFGAGVKVPLDDFLSLRFDVRDNLSQKGDAEDGILTHHPETLLGVTFTLDRSRPPPPPPPPPAIKDRDGDGVADAQDGCPDQPGPSPTGCPPPPDADGDGVLDAEDKCPDQPGPAPKGCPDPDGDGIVGSDDQCPEEAGPAPDGCPDLDPDRDGIVGEADQCPQEPETRNGFQDGDGCPDELPEAVKKFSGVIQGIEFDFGKAVIRPKSRGVLDAAASTLKEYSDLRVRITGHTDNVGDRERNIKLSLGRADAVKQYLVDHGIDAARLETRGAGPDEPLADNRTDAGRQTNRRIEFQVLVAEQPAAEEPPAEEPPAEEPPAEGG